MENHIVVVLRFGRVVFFILENQANEVNHLIQSALSRRRNGHSYESDYGHYQILVVVFLAIYQHQIELIQKVSVLDVIFDYCGQFGQPKSVSHYPELSEAGRRQRRGALWDLGVIYEVHDVSEYGSVDLLVEPVFNRITSLGCIYRSSFFSWLDYNIRIVMLDSQEKDDAVTAKRPCHIGVEPVIELDGQVAVFQVVVHLLSPLLEMWTMKLTI